MESEANVARSPRSPSPSAGRGSKSESSPNIWPGRGWRAVLPPVGRRAAELHPCPREDDVEFVAESPLVEQHVSAAQLGLRYRRAQRGCSLVVERAGRAAPGVVMSLSTNPLAMGPACTGSARRSHPVGKFTGTSRRRERRRGAGAGGARAGWSPNRWCPHHRTLGPCPPPLSLRRAPRWCAVPQDRPGAGGHLPRRDHRAFDFDDPFQLLVVTVPSAQTTDKRTTPSGRPLFAGLTPTRAMAARTGRRSRASSGCWGSSAPRPSRCSLSAALVERHGGEVPPRLDDLQRPGSAARRPTSCSATRSASRASLSTPTSAGSRAASGGPEETDPVKVEHAVGALFPPKDWTMLSHHPIWHGRRVCHPASPRAVRAPWRAGARRTAKADRPGGGGPRQDRGPGLTTRTGDCWSSGWQPRR